MRTQAMSKPRGEAPSPPFSIVPQVVPWGPLCNCDYLRSSFEESYLSLTNQSSTQGQVGWSKGGRGCAPAGRRSFLSLVAYGPKVFLLSLSHGGLQLLKPGRAVPNNGVFSDFSLDFLIIRVLTPKAKNHSWSCINYYISQSQLYVWESWK